MSAIDDASESGAIVFTDEPIRYAYEGREIGPKQAAPLLANGLREVLAMHAEERAQLIAERDSARNIAAAMEAQVAEIRDLAEKEHSGGCYYRHQQGESDECNSCAVARVTEPLWRDL